MRLMGKRRQAWVFTVHWLMCTTSPMLTITLEANNVITILLQKQQGLGPRLDLVF